MSSDRITNLQAGRTAATSFLAFLCAGAILFGVAMAMAQEGANTKPPDPPKATESHGFFASIGRWFEEQSANFKSGLKNAGTKVETFSQDAAKTTVEGAKEAAGAVARFPGTRVITGHEKCALAPNGAPDCVAAATAMCKAKGFESGKSADMTTAEVCSPQVYLSGRNSGPGCKTETFVSRALCQ
jgi:hypothetical protein